MFNNQVSTHNWKLVLELELLSIYFCLRDSSALMRMVNVLQISYELSLKTFKGVFIVILIYRLYIN